MERKQQKVINNLVERCALQPLHYDYGLERQGGESISKHESLCFLCTAMQSLGALSTWLENIPFIVVTLNFSGLGLSSALALLSKLKRNTAKMLNQEFDLHRSTAYFERLVYQTCTYFVD